MVVAKVSCQYPLQMTCAQNYEMVRTLSSYRADPALCICVLPGTLWSREHLLDFERSESPWELFSVYAIPISDQIAGCLAVAERFYHLLCGLF